IYPAADKIDLVAEVGREFDGEVIVAEDGLSLEV
ncbi:MAG: MBL fold metallo-hydrolase, partial [Rubrobacteraceae bacterium]|nr:MBL fold metallo-hydrolase [Rubrobacteraceae bacterium]